MHKIVLAGGMDRWKDKVREDKEMLFKGSKVVLRWLKMGMSVAFTNMQHHCVDQKRLRNAAAKIIFRMMNMAIVTSLHRWTACTSQAKQMRFKANTVLKRWSKVGLAGAWCTWEDKLLRRNLLRARSEDMVVLLQRMQTLLIAESFNTWFQLTAEHHRANAIQGKAAKKWLSKGVMLAFTRWREAALDQSRIARIMLRVAIRWNERSFAGAYHLWAGKTQLFAHQRNVLERIIFRMVLAEAAAAFDQWRAQAGRFKHQTKVMEKVLFRLTYACATNALESWRCEMSHRILQRCVMQKIVFRMQNGVMAGALLHWHSQYSLFTQQRSVLETVMYRMLHRLISAVFDEWHNNVSNLQRILRAGIIVVKRWQKMTICGAWSKWAATAVEAKMMRNLVVRSVLRWMGKCLVGVLDIWRHRVAEMKRIRHVAGKVVLRMMRVVAGTGQCLHTHVQTHMHTLIHKQCCIVLLFAVSTLIVIAFARVISQNCTLTHCTLAMLTRQHLPRYLHMCSLIHLAPTCQGQD